MGLIHAEPRSGYDLCKVFETTPMAHYSSSPGAIYPALKRMEKRGLLNSQTDRAESMKPRRVYRLGDAGREALEDWISQPVTRDELVWGMDGLMLRFSFMGQFVNSEVVCEFLRDLATAVDDLVAGLESHHRTMEDDEAAGQAVPTGRLALWQGIGAYRELARWARQSVESLSRAHPSR